MNNISFITRASQRLLLAFPFLAIALCTPSANAQSSFKAQITVSVTIGEPSAPELPDFQAWFEDFLGGTNPQNYQVTSTSDYDGDGQLDYLEYYAGTNPTDGASRLNIANVELSGDNARITWTSVPDTDPPEEPGNRFYRVFRCGPDDLIYLASPDATIESLDNLISSPNAPSLISLAGEIPSDGETTSYTDVDVKSQFPLFYRVFLSKPEPQLP